MTLDSNNPNFDCFSNPELSQHTLWCPLIFSPEEIHCGSLYEYSVLLLSFP